MTTFRLRVFHDEHMIYVFHGASGDMKPVLAKATLPKAPILVQLLVERLVHSGALQRRELFVTWLDFDRQRASYRGSYANISISLTACGCSVDGALTDVAWSSDDVYTLAPPPSPSELSPIIF